MKCDELEEEYLWTNNVKTPSTIMVRAYNADDVDEAIAELNARIQLDDDEMAGFLQLEEECGGGDLRKYIAELKAKLEDAKATAYAESVDAGMRERRLKRALWLLNANVFKWKALYFWYGYTDKPKSRRYSTAEDKCCAMADKWR